MTQTQSRVRPGDYFYTSWGYDQTNVDYLVVVKVYPSGKAAICQMASKIEAGGDGINDAIMPGVAYGERFTMRIRPDGRLRGSYPYCSLDKRLDTFYPVKLGETKYETNSMFGH